MDSDSWGFLESILIDVTFLIVILFCFKLLKKYRGNPEPGQVYHRFLTESSMKFRELLKELYYTDLEDIKEICGEESMNYLYLSKILAIFISVICIYSIVILIPVYRVGSADEGEMHNIGFYNIINDTGLLIAPQALFIVNVIASYYVLKLYAKETMKNHSHSTHNKSAVRVVNLHKWTTCKKMHSTIMDCLGGQCDVYVVPSLYKALVYKNQLETAKFELIHYLDFEQKYKKKDVILTNLFKWEKRDAIDYWEEKIDFLAKKIRKQRELGKTRNSGVCIISFQNRVKISELQKKLSKALPNCRVVPIVYPEDLIWENIENEGNSRPKHIFYTVLFVLVFLVILTPTATFGLIRGFLSDLGFPNSILVFLGLYAPQLLLILYQLVLVPIAVAFLVRQEKHTSKSHEVLSAMNKFLLFFMFSMLFIPAFGMPVVDIVIIFIESGDPSKISENLVKHINSTSIWFMVFILTQTFIVNGFDLLQLGILLEVKYKAFRAVSDREMYNAYLPKPMDYALEYATLLTVFTAIFIYSILYPLILLFGSLYLWLRVLAM